MNKGKIEIWAYLSMKKGTYDNDYYFFEDGTILHHYDQSMSKIDLESYVSPEDISDSEKEKILMKCKEECSSEIFKRIKTILNHE